MTSRRWLRRAALQLPLSLTMLVEPALLFDPLHRPRRPAMPDFVRQQASAPAEHPFVPLLTGSLDGWTLENSEGGNFTLLDGILRVEGPAGWLRYDRQQFTDFELRTEFRFVTPDADSGIFVRAVGERIFMRGWPGDSYQVQVRVPTTKSFLPPLGGIFRHGTPPGPVELDTDAVLKAFTGMNEWQRLEIVLTGETLVARVNGVETTRASGFVPRAGSIGIQGETGTVEYRSLDVRER
jgi:hypothetical protein